MNSSIGTSATSVWTASSDSSATVTTDDVRGTVLQVAAGGSVIHNLANQSYPQIDNVLPAKLSWKNVFSGGTNGQLDPATGIELQPSATAKAAVKLSPGATLFVDAIVAYGDSADSLQTVRLTCELAGTESWSTVDMNSCSSLINDAMDMRWIVTEDWSYNASWGPQSYLAGQRLSAMKGMSEFELLSGIGFRVEGTGAAQIDNLTLRGSTIDFAAEATTSTVTATTTGPAEPGAEVTITAHVSPATAAGTVAIFDGATKLGEGAANGGVFTVKSTALAAGAHALSARFTATNSAHFTASTSPDVTFAINAKQAPAPAPAATTEELLAGNTPISPEAFTPAAGPAANPLDALDPTKPLAGSLDWADPTDSFVDVYAYSTPIFLGTFPVVNGQVQLSGIDISALAAGGHHLVFVGQTSNSVSVLAVSVRALLAATGVDMVVPLTASGLLLLAGLGAVLIARRRRLAL